MQRMRRATSSDILLSKLRLLGRGFHGCVPTLETAIAAEVSSARHRARHENHEAERAGRFSVVVNGERADLHLLDPIIRPGRRRGVLF